MRYSLKSSVNGYLGDIPSVALAGAQLNSIMTTRMEWSAIIKIKKVNSIIIATPHWGGLRT